MNLWNLGLLYPPKMFVSNSERGTFFVNALPNACLLRHLGGYKFPTADNDTTDAPRYA